MKIKRFLGISLILLAMLSSFLSPTLFAYEAYAEGKAAEHAPEQQPLPEEYCMRDEYIVLTQNQDVHGYCWNFASTMAASTTIMKATGEYYDFSELWTGISACQCSGYSKPGAGGGISTHYNAMKTSGLMLECDLPYQESYTTSSQNAADYYNFLRKHACDSLSSCLTQNSSYISYKQENIEEIKRHILEKGSLYMAFSFHEGYTIDEVSSYLPPNQKNTNSSHAVSVIGWDDSFTKEVITDGSDTPTVFRGAWIILNSYTETNGKDGISLVFYEDENISQIAGYEYITNTDQDFYFYDKIEEGYAYPTGVKGKYYGSYKAETAPTKQKNIFYDDVNLTYSYLAPSNVSIRSIAIYLGEANVTNRFDIHINKRNQTFSVARDNADYGQYKMLVTYSNGTETDTYLNNFYVTYGLFGESLELDTDKNSFAISPGRDLEFYSFTAPTKEYVIYTNKTSGTLSFCALPQSVYSEKNMALPTLSYEITNGKSCTVTHTVPSKTGYNLTYTFRFEYYTDDSLQPVNIYYDLGGGQNHSENFKRELASPTSPLTLYAPTRPGYTFAGWYLDYGNGSKQLTEENGVYYLDWEDIHHMGEDPGLNALSHYKKYYNHSNTVFVYARWAEEEYCNVELTVVGNGTSSIGETISLRPSDVAHYIFTPNRNHCLFNVEIDGVSVSQKELVEIAEKGIFLKNVTEDISIVATFAEGIYLYLNIGENVESAYLARKNGMKTEYFYNGQCLPPLARPLSAVQYTLCVQVRDGEPGYFYILDDVNSFTSYGNGVYAKTLFMAAKNNMLKISTGSAQKQPIVPVNVTYSVPDYVTEHYISADPNATEGDTDTTYMTGQWVYIFVKRPSNTAEYSYTAPTDFSSLSTLLVGRNTNWYRRAICVNPAQPHIDVELRRNKRSYSVTWENWDGAILAQENIYYGDLPKYSLASLPQKPNDELHSYLFTGWSPEISPVTGAVTYTAQFRAVLRYTVTVDVGSGGTATPEGNQHSIHCEETKVYTFTPDTGYRVKDVKVNGVSVGAVEAYTFTDVSSDQTLSVEFEKIILNVILHCHGSGTISPEGTLPLAYGESLTVTITPDEGSYVDSIVINGSPVAPTQILTIENVTENTFVEISFHKIPPPLWLVMTGFGASSVALLAFSVMLLVLRKKWRDR